MLNIDNGFSLVKFAAIWCAPCKVLSKTLNKIEPEFTNIKFQEVDVDDYPDLAKEYKIRSVPTVIVFKDGEEVARLVGNVMVDALRKTLRDALKGKAA